ncbi:MAG: isoprenylcysteine carboxylmethyltransferase family protein [Chloroflexi bacterium]|nr:isoprenylcysteine carboxylmethyltransferase family protein [Chloroflexota bacterium]
MNRASSAEADLAKEKYITAGIRKWLIKSAGGLPVLAAILMLSAGRWDWLMGWVYVGLSLGATVFITLVLLRVNPEVLAVRGHGGIKKDAKTWDKVMSPFLAFSVSQGIWVVAGLDERFGWSPPLPVVLPMIGVILWVVALGVVTWAMAVNRFFEALVRIQTDRGHTVVSDGPYRYVRHPSYVAMLAITVAMPLILESWWGFTVSGMAVVVLILRTYLEDKTLRAELAGYEEYAQRVRYRLLPRIW